MDCVGVDGKKTTIFFVILLSSFPFKNQQQAQQNNNNNSWKADKRNPTGSFVARLSITRHVTLQTHTHTHVTTWQCRSDRIWSCHRGDFHFGDCFSTQGAVRSRAIWKSNFSQTCTWQPFTFRHCYVIALSKFGTLLNMKHFFLIELQLAKGSAHSSAAGILLGDLVIISNHCRREVTGEVYLPHSAE